MLHSAIKVNQPGKLPKFCSVCGKLTSAFVLLYPGYIRLICGKKTEKKSGSLKLQTIYILPSSIYSGVVAKELRLMVVAKGL